MTTLDHAEAQTDRHPSLPQISAGNYRKGKYRIHGMHVSIENPRGSVRTAKDGSWKVRMPTAYGYILGTKGADKDHLDCFLGPHSKSPLVYVIDQKDADTGKWDEHKCFFGFSSPQQVMRIYEAAFSDGRAKNRLGDLHELTVAQFRDWIDHGDTTKPMKPLQHRADGGRVEMADGGAPAFDPNAPFETAKAPAFDPEKPHETFGSSSEGLSSYIPTAVSDIPSEIGHAAGSAWDKIAALSDRSHQGPVEGLMTTGRAALAVPELLMSPVTGAVRSLVGHPMAAAEHMAGQFINPEVAAKDDPQKMYEQAKSDVDLAMAAARPAGAPVKVGGAFEWQPPAAAPSKPVGVVKQPETESFFDAAENNYSNMRGYGVEIDPAAMNRVADNILTELHAEGYRPRNAPKVFDAVDELRTPAGQNHEISDIDSVRKVLGKARMDPSERDAARRAIGHIDDYLSNLGNNPQDVVINPHYADRVGQEAQAARANYAAAKRAEDIDEALDQAERQAARSGAGGNINNAIRQRLSALRNNKKKMTGWTDAEKAELDGVINGTTAANAARQAGKFAPHGIVSTVMSAGAGHAIAPGIGEVAVPAAGLVAKMIGDRMTRIAAERLQNVVKARSPLGRQTSVNAAAQSAFQPAAPRVLPSVARAGLPAPNQVPLVAGFQAPIPSRAEDKQP